ncbi:anamorsin homolog isoform X1 [Salvia splendens]|uniref:anamorsin homolog isoform X1 n=1 Tax=Salvia splendens TaxID=180675 RepID=UPI001C25A482|nr:anamorsin homolog isoform X1 [Salvia splendens]
MGQDKLLVITDQVAVSISAVSDAIKKLRKEEVVVVDPMIITQATSGRYQDGDDSWAWHGARRTVLCGRDSPTECCNDADSRTDRQTGLALASSVRAPIFGMKCKKPSWKTGSSFALKKASQAIPKVQINDDDDLIDEDSLLTEEDLKKPQLPSGDCEVGITKKACKNCSCGRAGNEEKVKLGLTMDQIDNPQSACGSCGLGDAFRCSTCPYKGLPKFKLGEKIALSGNFLASDI